MTGHCRHFKVWEDESLDCPLAFIHCDCGWVDGPVACAGAWKTLLVNLFREHLDELEAAVAQVAS